MSATAVRGAQEYEDAYRTYYAEAAEEFRAVRVGEKETSEQAAIVARHAILFTEEQLEALRAAEGEAVDPDERERVYRLRRTCEVGIVDAEVAGREDELANALLAARLRFDGDELPLRTAEAQLAVRP
jgi:murein tripeptide amidase MpaA